MQSDISPEELRQRIGVDDPDASYSKSERLTQHSLLLSSIRSRVRDENDIVMAYSGPEGSGKSTLAIKHGFDFDKHFNLDDNIIVNPDPEKLQNKILHELKPHSCIVVDEAIRVLYKRDFSSFSNKFLVKLFAISRKCKKIVSLCIPDFNDLDPYYRKHRVKLWWYVPYRGKAVVFMPWSSPFCRDPWLLDENEKNMRKTLGSRSVSEYNYSDLINALKKIPNYVMDFEFSKMPEPMEKKYLENVENLRREMDFKTEQEKEKKEKINRYQELFYKMRGNFSKLTRYLSETHVMAYSGVAEAIGADKSQVTQIVRNDYEHRNKIRRKKQIDIEKSM